jgi:hypothetical protein
MVRNCGLLLEAARKAVAPLGGDESIYASSMAELDEKDFLADSG